MKSKAGDFFTNTREVKNKLNNTLFFTNRHQDVYEFVSQKFYQDNDVVYLEDGAIKKYLCCDDNAHQIC